MTPHPLPTGAKRAILDLLVPAERTAEEIAEQLDVTPAAVRQHLATLAGLGLVDRRRDEARGGRPAYLYRLSAAGRGAYPKRHDLLADQIVEALLEREGREETLTVVAQAARRLADAHRERFERLDPPARWGAVLAWLEEEFAWAAEVEGRERPWGRIVLHQCPFAGVSANHPAVCGTFLTTLLAGLVGRGPFVHRPIGDGIACCALEHGGGRTSELDVTLT